MAIYQDILIRKVDVPTLQKRLRAQGADPGDRPAANATLRNTEERVANA